MVVLVVAGMAGACDWPGEYEAAAVGEKPHVQPPPTVASQPAVRLPPPLTTRVSSGSEASEPAGLLLPVQGVTYAELRDTYAEMRGTRKHEAIDILAPRGTPVLSAVDGRLLKIFSSKAGGLMLYATDTSERFILLYGHLDSYAVGLSEGMQLSRGQVIGYVGTTGNAPPGTPHLHFGILRGEPAISWSKGTAINPYPLFMVPTR